MLLFKTNRFHSKVIRAFTNSEFDHAAMIIKFESRPGEVCLLNATGDRGVHLLSYEVYRAHIGSYIEKVAFRHIDWDRTEQAIDKL